MTQYIHTGDAHSHDYTLEQNGDTICLGPCACGALPLDELIARGWAIVDEEAPT